jgi:hypothetical protein
MTEHPLSAHHAEEDGFTRYVVRDGEESGKENVGGVTKCSLFGVMAIRTFSEKNT